MRSPRSSGHSSPSCAIGSATTTRSTWIASGAAARRRGLIRLVPERRHASGTTALDVSVGLPDGDTLMFRVAAPMPDPPLPWQLFIQLGALTLVLGIVLFLVTRRYHAAAVEARAWRPTPSASSVRHPPLAEEGVREIRDATRAFNTMQDRLLRYLDSRTSVLAAMSHDLRTPLTRMRLRVEAVADERLRTRFAADLDEMEGSGARRARAVQGSRRRRSDSSAWT